MIATLRDVTYSYPRATAPALQAVDLDIEAGSYALLAGPSGGGKSTLLRLFNGLVPQFHGGRLGGSITVGGLDPTRTPARRMATIAGMVFQEPEAQSVSDVVSEEVAFGMEQQAVSPPEMARRLDAILEAFGIDHLRHRDLATLSGGERQRVAIAAVLAVRPRLLLLDEPTSQLDPVGADAVLAAVAEARAAYGLTMLLAEHRLERLLHAVDRVIEVRDGRAWSGTPRDAAARLEAVPPVVALGRALGLDPLPLTIDEARSAVAALTPAPHGTTRPSARAPGAEVVAVEGLSVAYGEALALRDVSFALREGEIVALTGPNGSGKSTLFRAITGLVAPTAGALRLAGHGAPRTIQERTAIAGLLPQDPALALYRDTVRDEVAESLRYRRLKDAPAALDAWDIASFAERNPRDLSAGQQQRVAAAAMLAHRPKAWLMDEPTRGADQRAKDWLAERLLAHAAAGGAVIVATHDVEFAATCATRVIGLRSGEVAFDLPAARAFAAAGPLPTHVARLVPGAISLADVQR